MSALICSLVTWQPFSQLSSWGWGPRLRSGVLPLPVRIQHKCIGISQPSRLLSSNSVSAVKWKIFLNLYGPKNIWIPLATSVTWTDEPYELNYKVWIKFVYIDQKYDNLKSLVSVRFFFFFKKLSMKNLNVNYHVESQLYCSSPGHLSQGTGLESGRQLVSWLDSTHPHCPSLTPPPTASSLRFELH